ncbi:hypothetical protein DHEL01_v200309 [Diaporthe helianthi]|uniref:PH domain-containing protein n=1 Tax=Diaporthe helianthi TaxID=158607 RepID=A0A2P5IFL1_DIAHE|nr:hypothetical protein DHEL01_v200309 [Diaporthe helianthi]
MATAVTADVAICGDFEAERERWKQVDERWKAQERRVLSKEESDRLANILECETDRILAEQKKLDLARLHQQLVATQSTVSLSPSSLKPKSPVLEKFNFFNRARNSKAATLSPTSSTNASVDISRTHSLDPSLPPRAFVEHGGHGQLITPPLSPMSAHHFQERRVAVRCRGVTVNLVAVADSSPVDILFQASESITQHISTASSLVYECYTQLGLERRLRRYERICDVLDSWDHDAQNLLLVIPSGSSDGDKDLDISSVPTTLGPPPGFFLQLHHSSRPGKWSKRWITLLDDGQIISSKKGESNRDKSAQWLCHLAEYDIYTLMSKSASSTDEFGRKGATAVTKNLKPPKKFVYALKSQQKTMSSDSANFVHFFCTDDPTIANKFTARVHSWRSWYMVKSRREAQRKRLMEDAPQITPVKHKPRKSISHMKIPGQKHRIKLSVDETPYTIGDFQPLVEMERFEKPIDDFGKDWIPDPRLSALPPAVKDEDAVTTEGPATIQEELVADVQEITPVVAPEPRSSQARPKTPATGAEGGLQPLIDGIQVGVGIAVSLPAQPSTNINIPNECSPQQDLEPGPGPEAQVRSWLPSAVEHTAKQKYEQQRLERLHNNNFSPTPKQQQRPSTSSGVAQSQRHYNHHVHHHHNHNHNHNNINSHYGTPQPARGSLRQVNTRATAQSALGEIARNYRAVSRWAETGSPSPTGALGPSNGSGSPKFLEVPGARNNHMLPALQRPALPSPSSRPSTSGGERGRNNQYQIIQQQQQQQQQYQQALLQKQMRARSGSMSSMRRGGGAIGGPPVDPPPMPPLPPQMRALVREAQR